MAKKKAGKDKGAGKVKKSDKVGKHLLNAADMGKLQETFSHPWNPNSEIVGVAMGYRMGLKRAAVNFARIPPGKESYLPHAHQREEEWVYVLYGQGEALIGDEWTPVGTGDFIAFPAPQIVHHLKNTGSEDLVFLEGGEALRFEIVDFPTVGRRTVRIGEERTVYETKSASAFPAAKAKSKKK